MKIIFTLTVSMSCSPIFVTEPNSIDEASHSFATDRLDFDDTLGDSSSSDTFKRTSTACSSSNKSSSSSGSTVTDTNNPLSSRRAAAETIKNLRSELEDFRKRHAKLVGELVERDR